MTFSAWQFPQGGIMTANELKVKHKELKREVREAEKMRDNIRDWQSKEALINLKKEKLRLKDELQKRKS